MAGDLWARAAADDFKTIHFQPRRDYDLKTALALARLIDAEKPDVLHAHHPKAHAMGLLAKFFTRHKPVFVFTRRVSHPIVTGFFAKLKYTSRLIDGCIAVADSVRSQLIAYGLAPERVRTIYSGTDPERFSPHSPAPEIIKELSLPGQPVVMLVGNFSVHKGQHVLIEAARLLRLRGLEFTLVFAGRGTDSEELRILCRAAGLPEAGCRFLGLREDVERLLSVAAVSVNAAIKGEALSGSIRESLAMGVPAVASNISGNAEIVREGVTGLLFPPGDSAVLADRLETVLKNPDLRDKFSKNSVETVRAGFTTAIMGRRTLEYYRELLSAAAAARK
jgi:glycosyltransferase involved in cell wall biosynthesis